MTLDIVLFFKDKFNSTISELMELEREGERGRERGRERDNLLKFTKENRE